jgi:hypothetical protein
MAARVRKSQREARRSRWARFLFGLCLIFLISSAIGSCGDSDLVIPGSVPIPPTSAPSPTPTEDDDDG